MQSKTCCFSGHRDLNDAQMEWLILRLEKAIGQLIGMGVRTFLCSGAVGFDTLAAMAVLKWKKRETEVKLVMVLPCRDQTRYWAGMQKATYDCLCALADETIYVSERYTRGCMQRRNRAMVERSSWCVCYLTKERGGTAGTVEMCRKRGMQVLNLVGFTQN